MRILYIASDTKALGGIQQYNRKFLDSLRARGDEVVLVELKGGGFLAKARFIVKCFIQGVRHRPDLTVCAHVNYAPFGLFMKKWFGQDYIVCTHGIDVWEVRGALRRKALQEADLITTVAEFTRDKIVRQLPEVRDRIYLLYNCVDGARFVPKVKSPALIKRYGLEGKKAIFTIARLLTIEGYKGYDRVIKAMPQILRAVPNAVYLLSGEGDDMPRVQKLVHEMGLEDKVIMTGYVPEEEMVDHYNLADVFIMPSKAEGAPAVFVEALACGIPVIAGNKDGSATPLMGGELGLLIDPESVDEIVAAIINILTGKVRKELLDRDFLRRKVLEKFGLDRFPQRVDEMFNRIEVEEKK